MKRDREMACVAEDLSMSANKKTKRTTTNNSIKTEVKEQNSRLPEGTFLKTDVITQIMDIQEPLASLRTLLENRLGVDLSSFQFWLQDKVKMLPQKSIGDQCIQTEGLAQVKVELKQLSGNNRINIIDVLKYSDDATDDEEDGSVEDLSIKNTEESTDSSNESSPSRWSIYEDINSLFPIPLPSDPESWTEIQIHHWLRWAMQEFKVQHVCESMWNITGKQLCQMDKREFHEKVPVDHHDLLWTHIELLRKCRIFAVVDKNGNRQIPQPSLTQVKPSQSIRKPRTPSSSSTASIGNGRRPCMTGHNGQIQLWQFLLELLGNKSRKNVIQWVGRNGEFKLNDPELVAQMWGERKNKPKMNYEKLSRALRYYYSESMIAKVHGRRFVYKFVCNLKELVGYTSEELISMVDEDLATLNND